MPRSDGPELPALFRAFERTDQSHLGTFWWGRLSEDIPDAYREAAHRLFDAAQPGGLDAERILLPILYLYRHSIEALLKQSIMVSAVLRYEAQDADAENPVEVEKILTRQIRHKIAEIRDLLDRNLLALGLNPLSDVTSEFLGLLADLDPSGNTFRFARQLPDVHISLDLPRIMASFDAAFSELIGVREYLTVQVDDQRDWKDYLDDDFY
ncbi:MAG TPA: hypothetical protein VK537_01355 [Galbitalea sp.]|nr:hypothetical protein [Galbitalea sp.]